MKSNAKTNKLFLIDVFESILRDAIVSFPDVPIKEWKRDSNRFCKLMETRGLGFLILDLPQLDDAVLATLQSGLYPNTRPILGRHKPSFFKGLWNRIIDETGRLLDMPDPTAIFFLRQFANFAKKVDVPCSDARSKEKIHEYVGIEEDIRAPSERWFARDIRGFTAGHVDRSLDDVCYVDLFDGSARIIEDDLLRSIQTVSDFVTDNYVTGLQEFLALRRRNEDHYSYKDRPKQSIFRHGPGASNDASRYANKWKFDYISPRILQFFDKYDLTTMRSIAEWCNSDVLEKPSKVSLVPKDGRGPRIIAAEPIANMFVQQAGFRYLERIVVQLSPLRNLIDFRSQGLSQHMAKIGSVDGNLSTIDLKNASDKLSLWLVERLFRKNQEFLEFLYSVRSFDTSINGVRLHNLRKFASQGNAMTFPLQTIVYTIICLGVKLHYDKLNKCTSNWIAQQMGLIRAFGDDLIVPTSISEGVIEALHYCGLQVNTSKSFTKGLFRESCGGDFYGGYNVTPLKIRKLDDKTPEFKQGLIDVSNLAHVKGLWHLANLLMNKFENAVGGNRVSIPIVTPLDSKIGFVSFAGSTSRHLQKRWNDSLQTIQVRSWTSLVKKKTTKRPKRSRVLMQKFLDMTKPGFNIDTTSEYELREKLVWA